MQKIKNRMMQLLRMLFVLAILIILVAQLLDAIKLINIKNDSLQGGFVQVESNEPANSSASEKEMSEDGWFESLLNMLKNYYRGE
jgi:hypothetical protein